MNKPAHSAAAAAARTTVYTLELQHGKFYVGKTAQPMKDRFRQHLQGTGAAWTRLHRPVRVLRAVPCTSDHQEDNTTLDMMREHGIDNVRGGVYCQPRLSLADERAAKKCIAGMRGACIRCFRTSHLANTCFARTDAYGCDLGQSDVWRGGGAAAAAAAAHVAKRRRFSSSSEEDDDGSEDDDDSSSEDDDDDDSSEDDDDDCSSEDDDASEDDYDDDEGRRKRRRRDR